MNGWDRPLLVGARGERLRPAAAALSTELAELGLTVVDAPSAGVLRLEVDGDVSNVDFAAGRISPAHSWSLIEQALHCIPFDYDALETLVEGESKEVRLLTDRVVVERFKPTVYSFTHNRYGIVEGTEITRACFAAEVFRRMAWLSDSPGSPRSAFLASVETARGPALIQRRVEDSNLEVRIKRYHVGSPVHRYLYTERHPSTQTCGPLARWSRFDRPVVCFDWRHPLEDGSGRRLADEPLSDDYAGIWVDDVPHAKEMTRATFLWLEKLMDGADLVLVDMCVFIDRTGHLLFGEISPDCMRVRAKGAALDGPSFDKDAWRSGAPGATVARQYQALHERLFGARGVVAPK